MVKYLSVPPHLLSDAVVLLCLEAYLYTCMLHDRGGGEQPEGGLVTTIRIPST